MQRTLNDINAAMSDYGDTVGRQPVRWKGESLEHLAAGSLRTAELEPFRIRHNGSDLYYTRGANAGIL